MAMGIDKSHYQNTWKWSQTQLGKMDHKKKDKELDLSDKEKNQCHWLIEIKKIFVLTILKRV